MNMPENKRKYTLCSDLHGWNRGDRLGNMDVKTQTRAA